MESVTTVTMSRGDINFVVNTRLSVEVLCRFLRSRPAATLIEGGRFHRAMLDSGAIRRVDRSGMLEIVASLPTQLLEGYRNAESVRIDLGDARRVFLAGMGGSGIAGDLFVAWASDRSKLGMEVVRGYHCPATAQRGDVMIALSYSGDTEETLSAVAAAEKVGCRVIGITSNGKLAALCTSRGYPLIRVPPGLPPRGAFGHLFASLPAISEDWVYGDLGNELERAAAHLMRLREDYGVGVAVRSNPAKALAVKVRGKTPIVYAAPPYGPVATRWKTQFNENSEVLAWASQFPEADHNEIVGWGGDPSARRFLPILLRDREESPEMARRLDATKKIMSRWTKVYEIRDRGETLLSRMLGILFLGDFASVYLAVLRNVDPTPVKPIVELKKRLAA
ncbi:MAG: bifunctional phosphoglucose/phosphomannose isomerase [Methanobacteriota archaeon]|nr:MAG: bifunctional phosphoglucose/phosphomannose isomerase [Euryarchaeota archaeon]